MVSYLLYTLLFLNIIASSVFLLSKGLLAWAKDFVDERFRYIGCIAIMLLFLIPFYQVLPISAAQKDMVWLSDEPSIESASAAIPEDDFPQKDISAEKNNVLGISRFHLDIRVQKKILVAWSVGASILALWYLFALLQFRLGLFKKNSKPIPDEVQQIANYCAREFGIRQMPILKVSSAVQSPMLIGFFKPIIAMPVTSLSTLDAELVLKHELVHFKRRDLWWKLLGVLLQIIHWFNPIAWLLCKEFEFCAETSCDAEVVKNLDYDERKHYGYLLISYVQPHHNLKSVSGISFISTHSKLKERISIMLCKKKTHKMIASAIVCVLTMSGFALSAFAAENSTPEDIFLAPNETIFSQAATNVDGESLDLVEPFALTNGTTGPIEDSVPLSNDVFERGLLNWNDIKINYNTRKNLIRKSSDPNFIIRKGVTATLNVSIKDGSSENIQIEWYDSKNGKRTTLFNGSTASTSVSYTPKWEDAQGYFCVWNKSIDAITINASLSY